MRRLLPWLLGVALLAGCDLLPGRPLLSTTVPSATPAPSATNAPLTDTPDVTPVPTATPTVTLTPSPTPSPTPTPTPTEIPPETLDAALLAAIDLPGGWQPGTLDRELESRRTSAGEFLCAAVSHRPRARASAGFARGPLGPYLVEGLALYSPGEIGYAFAEAETVARSCTQWTAVDASGVPINWTFTMLTYPQFGDGTFAVRSSTILLDSRVTWLDAIYVRAGDVMLSLAYIATAREAPAAAETEDLVRRAYSRLQATLQGSGGELTGSASPASR